MVDRAETHFVAIDEQNIVGWCDVQRQVLPVRQHVGTLGMAVAASHRGRGIGRSLIERVVEHASVRGITRIELTVRADNTIAQRLYASMGFETECLQKKAWRMDEQYVDVYCMARIATTLKA